MSWLRGSALFILLFLVVPQARPEYRVFLLKIYKSIPPTGPGQKASEGDVRYVESNLDPEQYVGYYPVAPDETVKYVQTWKCRGRTDHREYCPNPRAPAAVADGGTSPTQGPESAQTPKVTAAP